MIGKILLFALPSLDKISNPRAMNTNESSGKNTHTHPFWELVSNFQLPTFFQLSDFADLL